MNKIRSIHKIDIQKKFTDNIPLKFVEKIYICSNYYCENKIFCRINLEILVSVFFLTSNNYNHISYIKYNFLKP